MSNSTKKPEQTSHKPTAHTSSKLQPIHHHHHHHHCCCSDCGTEQTSCQTSSNTKPIDMLYKIIYKAPNTMWSVSRVYYLDHSVVHDTAKSISNLVFKSCNMSNCSNIRRFKQVQPFINDRVANKTSSHLSRVKWRSSPLLWFSPLRPLKPTLDPNNRWLPSQSLPSASSLTNVSDFIFQTCSHL